VNFWSGTRFGEVVGWNLFIILITWRLLDTPEDVGETLPVTKATLWHCMLGKLESSLQKLNLLAVQRNERRDPL